MTVPDPGRIRVTEDRPIAHVVLDRPARLNALDKAMWVAFGGALSDLSTDDTVRCVVISGAGGVFGSGADIGEFDTELASAAKAQAYGRSVHAALDALRTCPHPTVAAIEGACVGGALELAVFCDLRICGESSRFGVPINRIGITMSYPMLAGLVDLVGRARALEILLEGRVVDAAEAHRLGLVSRVVPDAEVASAAADAARRIAAAAPLANRGHKAMALRLADPRPLTPEEEASAYACFDSADCREGVAAFLAKRKPAFRGE